MSNKTILQIYVVVAFMTAIWFDAMDRKFVPPEHQTDLMGSALYGALWPISLPATLTIMASPVKQMRWTKGWSK